MGNPKVKLALVKQVVRGKAALMMPPPLMALVVGQRLVVVTARVKALPEIEADPTMFPPVVRATLVGTLEGRTPVGIMPPESDEALRLVMSAPLPMAMPLEKVNAGMV